jgi:DNA repair exonuclease SbcCD ATPase subunit
MGKESYIQIKATLKAVRRELLWVHLAEGLALMITVSLLAFLLGSGLLPAVYPLLPTAYAPLPTVYCLLSILVMVYTAYRYVFLPLAPFSSEDRLAYLVEERRPDLKDSLINSVQLGRDLLEPQKARFFSHDLVEALLKDTARRLEGLDPREIVPRQGLWRNLKGLTAVVLLFGLLWLLYPGYLLEGYQILRTGHPVGARLVMPLPGPPVIGDFVLTYKYPMYTGLPPRTVSGTSGDLKALRGSQVEITASCDRPVASANLVVNGVSRTPVKVEGNSLKGSIILLEGGNYCFETTPPIPTGEEASPPQESRPYSITIEEDEYPTITLQAPEEVKVVMEKEKVAVQYRAGDDFGLKEIRLVLEGKGTLQRAPTQIETFETTPAVREHRGSYDWNLAGLKLSPGEKLAYHLEALDNDTVSGPKVARSRTHYLEVHSPQKRHYESLSLQEALFKEMVQVLAEELVKTPSSAPSREELLLQQEVLKQKGLGLLDLFRKVLTDMEEDALANYTVFYSLQNMQSRLSGLFEEKEEKVLALRRSFSTRPIEDLQAHQEKEIQELEVDVLFLVELLRKERLDDFMGMDRQVENSQQALTQLLEDLRQGKEGASDQALKELERLEELIKEMMEKLSQMSSRWTEEFINMDALKQLADVELTKELEEMRKALERGDLEGALQSALKAMDSLEKILQQMGQSAQQYVDSTYSETLQKMQNLDKRLQELEEKEKLLTEATERLKKDLQSRTQEKLDTTLEDFFQRQGKRLDKMQEELAQLETHLGSHPRLKEYSSEEKEVSSMLKDRGRIGPWPFMPQQPLNQEEMERLSEKMARLNQAKRKDPMIDTYSALSKELPNLNERLSQQEEMLKGQDLKESLEMSRQSLKDLRYWNSEVRRDSPGGFPNQEAEEFNEEASEHLSTTRRLAEEMVKELESLASAFEDRSKSLTQEEKEAFGGLAKRQGELGDQAQSLSQSLEKLSQGNPIIGPESSEHLGKAEVQMGEAGQSLSRENAPQALTEEGEALSELAQARKELGKSMERMAKGMMSKGMPMPQYVLRYRDLWEDGDRGFSLEEVKIPTAEAYKVPKEFRQDILDAMKQGLPQKYQELNKDYYRKLVE